MPRAGLSPEHVGGLPDLRRRLALAGITKLGAVLREATAGRTGRDALAATAQAYLAFARRHPGRYAAALRAPDPDDPGLTAAATDVTRLVLDVVTG